MLIHASGLSARYDTTLALSDLSFHMEPGEILAILGPNGSGKTTLFRLLLGLLRPCAGSLEVFDAPPGLPASLDRIGATIEIPSLYGHLSALENLQITAHLKGGERSGQLCSLLEEVDLAGTGKAPVSTFSLGMRQRLALAQALVGQPELLILDEPTNGLDPEGIRWFREWVALAPAERGLSVILSSHILHEVAQVAHRLILLKEGRSRFAGTLAELHGDQERTIHVATRDLEGAEALLRQHGFQITREAEELRLLADPDRAPEVARLLLRADHDLLHLGAREATLEDRYLALMEAE